MGSKNIIASQGHTGLVGENTEENRYLDFIAEFWVQIIYFTNSLTVRIVYGMQKFAAVPGIPQVAPKIELV